MTKNEIKEIMTEARIVRGLTHPNVVQLIGVAVIKEPLMIVMELVYSSLLNTHLNDDHFQADQGELLDYVKKHRLVNRTKLKMILDAAQGLDYVHRQNWIHRDVALRNFLYAADTASFFAFVFCD